MRLKDDKIKKFREKGFLPLLEWCRKQGVSNASHVRELCKNRVIPSLLVDETFLFIPAHHKREDLRGGSAKRGKVKGDEVFLKLSSLDEIPLAEDVKPKKKRVVK